jgi:hypothetical protein
MLSDGYGLCHTRKNPMGHLVLVTVQATVLQVQKISWLWPYNHYMRNATKAPLAPTPSPRFVPSPFREGRPSLQPLVQVNFHNFCIMVEDE